MQLWSLTWKPSTQTAIMVKSKERTRTSVCFIWLGLETCCLKWKDSVFLDECLSFMTLVWSGCTVRGVIFSNLFWEGFADYFKLNINILDNSWHADLDQTNVLISRWPARPPERQPALSEHVQEWYWYRERETDWPSIRVHHRPPGTPGCLFEQSMIPVVCWSNQLRGSLCPSLPEKHRYIQLYFIKTEHSKYTHAACLLTVSLLSFNICPIWNSTKFMTMDLVKFSRAYAAAKYGIRRHCWKNTQ